MRCIFTWPSFQSHKEFKMIFVWNNLKLRLGIYKPLKLGLETSSEPEDSS